ncbi:MAG: U32 family peptidase [Muribaculaceae bacterium]|nr:U32 family peptidase [Muribaculaceae bacterium]
MAKPTLIELLAPARDADIAIAAIDHGADAVYMGASHHGARADATNTLDDVRRACNHAHQFGARIYATVNTLIYDDELKEVERLVHDLYRVGVDALIVQDLGLLRLDLPPIALHASTQCDLRTPEKARFLEALGFSQLVMARELTLDEIAAIRRVTTTPLEAFVHGALCVSYSGRCAISQVLKGRSANRGECAQLCRLPYDLVDGQGRVLIEGKHLLSLRDMARHDRLEQMMAAGVSSFKIEGRLKDIGYVKNVVAYYRRAIDHVIDRHPDRYRRSSFGQVDLSFEPVLEKSFNRGFTHYFLDKRCPADGTAIASIDTPKSQGEPLGRVVRCNGNTLTINTRAKLTNGDGLSYYDAQGTFTGTRINRALDGGTVLLRERVAIPRGTLIYRTADKAFNDLLAKPSATRTIAVNAELRYLDGTLVLTLDDERGNHVTHNIDCDLQAAAKSQADRQIAELGKLGGTVYRLQAAQVPGDIFIPASLLARLRRETVELLDRAHAITRPVDKRRPEDKSVPCPVTTLSPADNVANRLTEQLYHDHGVSNITPALEVGAPVSTSTPLMHTRYCIRRQLGACLKDKNVARLPRDIYLKTGTTLLRVTCDCKSCEMLLTLAK